MRKHPPLTMGQKAEMALRHLARRPEAGSPAARIAGAALSARTSEGRQLLVRRVLDAFAAAKPSAEPAFGFLTLAR